MWHLRADREEVIYSFSYSRSQGKSSLRAKRLFKSLITSRLSCEHGADKAGMMMSGQPKLKMLAHKGKGMMKDRSSPKSS
jgi:hypothetical protein